MALIYRHPTIQDLDLITSVMNLSRRETLYHRGLTSAEVNTETFEDPDYRPEGAWLVFDGAEVLAYGIAVVEQGRIEAGLDDGWVEIDIVPGGRGRGTEKELMRLATSYLRTRGVGRAMTKIEETEKWKISLFLDSGFESVRHFYRLARRGLTDLPSREMPSELEVTHRMLREMSDEDIAVFTEVLNDTFSEHFEWAPEPVWRWVKWRDACEDPWMIALARAPARTVAVCAVEDSKGFNAERGTRSGWICLLGVRKDLRGKGLGTAMLLDGMRWLKGLGHDTAYIGVDAENETALGLYKTLGFEVENETQVYRLDLKKTVGGSF